MVIPINNIYQSSIEFSLTAKSFNTPPDNLWTSLITNILRSSLTISRGVSQQLADLLVGGVLSQSAHDVSDLVISHLVVTHPVEQTEGLLVVCGAGGKYSVITPLSSFLSGDLCLCSYWLNVTLWALHLPQSIISVIPIVTLVAH